MADIAPVNASVVVVSGTASNGTSGATITAGQVLYLDANDQKLKLAKCTTEVEAEMIGVACSPAYPNQRVSYLTEGILDLGVNLTAGETYQLSVNAGGMRDVSQLTTTSFVTYVGYGNEDGDLVLLNHATGVQKV